MMNTLSNIAHIPQIVTSILHSVRKQKRFIKKHISPIVDEYKNADISSSDRTKMESYYGIVVPVLLEGFCMLRGEKLSPKERLTITYLAAMTGLYDDFFDKFKIPDARILALTSAPFETQAENDHESLFLKLYKQALTSADNPEAIIAQMLQVYDAQIKSKLQFEVPLSPEQIKEITFLKGGVSLLLYRITLKEAVTPSESELIHALGSLTQLENDIFDVYKDREDNIQTLATTTTALNEFRILYTELHNRILQLIVNTPFPRKNKAQFARLINLMICRGYVCLDFLQRSENETNHVFLLQTYTRQQLVCDMEAPANMLRVLQYYAKSNLAF